MTTPSTYAGSEEDALSCLAARSHILDPSTLPELDAHLATCEPCAVLAADHALLGHALNDLPQPKLDLQKMAATVQDQLQQESGVRSTLQRWSTPKRIAALLTLSAVIVVATGFGAPRADLSVYPAERMASMALALLMAGLLTVFRALRPLSDSRATPWLILATGLLLPVIFAGLPAAHLDHPDALIHDNFLAKTATCFAFGALGAAAVGKLAHFLDRRSFIDLQAGIMVAAAGGIVGNLALQLHCPITAPLHLLLGHATVGSVFVLGLILALSRRK
ncbi:MAG: hypothetical protein GWP91_15115 [Rhodobacterales bacterium]|nr:hypothetical protein [Rhodobacterales bacterium]